MPCLPGIILASCARSDVPRQNALSRGPVCAGYGEEPWWVRLFLEFMRAVTETEDLAGGSGEHGASPCGGGLGEGAGAGAAGASGEATGGI